MHCRFGVVDDGRAGWTADPEGCPAQLSRADAVAHEAACEHALEACPFAGCGLQRRRRDADAHDAAAALAHARGERDARLALEASARAQQSRLDAVEATARAGREAQQARMDALEARLGAGVPTAAVQQTHIDAVAPAAPFLRRRLAPAFVDEDEEDIPLAAVVPAAPVQQTRSAAPFAAFNVADRPFGWASRPGGAAVQQARFGTFMSAAAFQQERIAAVPPNHSASVVPVVGGDIGGAARAIAGAMRRATLNGAHCIYASDWSPDGSLLVSGHGCGALKLWDVVTLECTATLTGHANMIWDCAWSPDGRTVASSSQDNTLKLWIAETRTCVATLALQSQNSAGTSCSWSPDGRLVATVGGAFKVWDAASHSCTATVAGNYWCCAWSPDGSKVLLCDGLGGLAVWDVATHSSTAIWDVLATHRSTATLRGHAGLVYSCAWNPDGRSFATSSHDMTVKLWSAAAPFNCTQTLEGHTNIVRSCAWSTDGCTIASSSDDKTTKLWDAATGNCCVTLQMGHQPKICCWSPDGNALAVGCAGGSLVLYDVQRA